MARGDTGVIPPRQLSFGLGGGHAPQVERPDHQCQSEAHQVQEGDMRKGAPEGDPLDHLVDRRPSIGPMMTKG